MTPIIIVPYRDREENLSRFIPAMNRYLPSAKIVVVEQCDQKPFNKGALINVGMTLCKGKGDYYMFHDVDLLPVKVDYSFPECPTHVATELSQFNYSMPYPNYFGGCVMFKYEHYEAINGFSNRFSGWGCEDDDFYESFKAKGIPVLRRTGTFESMPHQAMQEPKTFAKNVEKLVQGRDFSEGLSTVKFEIISQINEKSHIHLMVKI